MKARLDPADMTARQRLAEIADILALGYLRLSGLLRKELDEPPSAEAPCDSVDARNKRVHGKEVA